MPASDIPDIIVPQEDGAIREALANLDRKLAVHAAAVRDAEAQLHDLAQQAGLSVPPMPEPESPKQASPADASVARVPRQRLKNATPPAPAEEPKPAESSAEIPTPEPAEVTASSPPAAESAGLSDEEALLASLDEATSKAVRVLRRLNPNKSVQELLRQVEKQKDAASSAPKPAAKSWFRRR